MIENNELKARYQKRIRFALLIAVLIAALLWNTQWPALRPGLVVLLTGQLALAAFLLLRSRGGTAAGEASITRQANWLEHGSRGLGFLMLAYGFWRSTGNVLISVLLGLVYPLVSYWGMGRLRNKRAP